jgi:transglutaminase/protease-like cytokinesis protein 3
MAFRLPGQKIYYETNDQASNCRDNNNIIIAQKRENNLSFVKKPMLEETNKPSEENGSVSGTQTSQNGKYKQ